MASAALLDFEALTAPLPGDNPAGAPVTLPLRQKLDAARKEFEPNPDDPSAPPIPRKPDWAGLVRQLTDVLTKQSRDLVMAARLVEAMARQYGFAGVRDSLHLVGLMVGHCWDRILPVPDEDEGMEVRAGPFIWLSDPEGGARFPYSLRSVPLLKIDGQAYSWQNWKQAQAGPAPDAPPPDPDAPPAVTTQDFERAVPLSDDVADDLDQCLVELTTLEQLLHERLGDQAPSLVDLRQALEDSQHLLKQVLRRLEPLAAAGAEEGQPAGEGNGAVALSGRAITSREEAYRQLANIANVLEQIEPHSPIPDLLRRAIDLGRMPFRKLISELIRDANMLSELRREFGIREADSSS